MYEDIAEIIIEKIKEPRIRVVETSNSSIVFCSITSRNDVISLLEFLENMNFEGGSEVYKNDEYNFSELDDKYDLQSFIIKNRTKRNRNLFLQVIYLFIKYNIRWINLSKLIKLIFFATL